MADLASNAGFLYDDQGFVDIVNSPFFDFNHHVDGSVEEYVERIIFTLTEAIEEQLSDVQWCIKAGKRIEFITAGGRTTAFVPELQKLIGVKSMKGKSNQSRKAKPDEEEDDEGSKGEEIEREREIKRQPKKGKNKKVGSHRQQKKVDDSGDNSEEANEKEKPKKKNGKKPLAADKIQRKVVVANRNELKSLDIRAKTQAKESSKKRSGSNEASTQQKKKTRK